MYVRFQSNNVYNKLVGYRESIAADTITVNNIFKNTQITERNYQYKHVVIDFVQNNYKVLLFNKMQLEIDT